jgi:anti-anti-sigma factor
VVDFGVTSTSANGRTLITLVGEFDIRSVDALHAAIEVAAASDDRQVHVDMAQVDFIDSAGLGGLIRAYKRFDEDGRQLRIIDPSPTVVRLLKLTGQLERFTEM